jgi:hypothetical protein
MVVVIDSDQVAELQVAGSGCGLTSNALHSAAIAEEHERVVVDQLEVGLVEDGRCMRLRNSETDCIGETLAERASRDFNTGGIVRLWVARCDAIDLL